MTNEKVLLDPTSESTPSERSLSERPETMAGLTVGLLDISKERGDIFLNRLEEKFSDTGIKILRFEKPTFTKPAPIDLRHEIASKCDAVIEALAD